MQKSMLTTLTGYNLWANKKMIEMISTLPKEVLDAEVQSSYATLRKTIYHIWDAQVIWLSRLQGTSPSDWPSKAFGDNYEEFAVPFLKHAEEFHQFVISKSEDFLASTIHYKNLSGKEFQTQAWQVILHCMNHGTYHRGQLITMLRQLSITTHLPSTDLIFYFRELP